MKTTKKRLLLGVAGFALCTGVVFTTLAATAKPQITDETMLANIEALSYNVEIGDIRGECNEPWSNICFEFSGEKIPGVLVLKP